MTLLSTASKSSQSTNTAWCNWRILLARLGFLLYARLCFSCQIWNLFFRRRSSRPRRFEELLLAIVKIIACYLGQIEGELWNINFASLELLNYLSRKKFYLKNLFVYFGYKFDGLSMPNLEESLEYCSLKF